MIRELGAFLVVAVATSSGLPQGAGCVCPFNYAPVCGSDGHTYGNACGLRCAQASQPDLVMKSTGQCSSLCTLDLNPVCGTDGSTYDNECAMKSLGVSKLHDGECEKVVHVAARSIPTCTCTRNYKPVCGTDGTTYNNDCLLNCATGSNPQLGIRHPGACEVNVINSPSKCTCTRNYKPVCGTDGQTYHNDCLLNCATIDNSRLGIAHAGSCEQVKVVPISLPSCTCTMNFEPVCGTDGRTYPNDCLLNCATMSNSKLGISHRGQCDQDRVQVVNSSDDRCACQRQYKPVCASNGETYNNDCLLNCAQKDTPDLRMVYEGVCEVLRG